MVRTRGVCRFPAGGWRVWLFLVNRSAFLDGEEEVASANAGNEPELLQRFWANRILGLNFV